MAEFPGCLLIVTAEIDPAVEAEWNRWYDTVHLPDALKCPGVRHGRRYVSSGEISETSGGKTDRITKRIYTTIYEIDSPGTHSDGRARPCAAGTTLLRMSARARRSSSRSVEHARAGRGDRPAFPLLMG